MVENMFFLDGEHVGMGGMLPPPKKLFVCSCYMLGYFTR